MQSLAPSIEAVPKTMTRNQSSVSMKKVSPGTNKMPARDSFINQSFGATKRAKITKDHQSFNSRSDSVISSTHPKKASFVRKQTLTRNPNQARQHEGFK